MIGVQLKALLWLRWRLMANQLQRMGVPGALLGAALLLAAVFAVVSTFFAALILGLVLLPKAEPHHVLISWSGIVGVFLLFWLIGLSTDLQRAELLPTSQLLHLPVTPKTVFLINYLGSFFSLTLIVFVPAMVAFAIAQLVIQGPASLILMPLIAGFLLMVTAATYQLRGWLAALMENQRRRRTVIALVTMSIVILVQAPNIAHMTWLRANRQSRQEKDREKIAALGKLQQSLDAGEISQAEFGRALAAMPDRRDAGRNMESLIGWLSTACRLLPPGWLPYGAQAAATGRVFPGIMGVAGSLAIAAICLRRGYLTTLRLYRGEFQSGRGRQTKKQVASVQRPASNWLEKRLPALSDQAGAVALANLRSLTRAPEAKMALLSPLLVFLMFGAMLYSVDISTMPTLFRPLVALGIVWFGMTSVSQLTQNQFGYDRDGFRLLVLSPVDRREILLGKNLSIAPLGLGVTAIGLLLFQWLAPLSLLHCLATCVQAASLFVIFCMTANVGSILAAMPTVAGARRKAQPGVKTIAMQFACALLTAVASSPLTIPWCIDALLEYSGWLRGGPVYLALSAVVLAGAVWLYPRVIKQQGRWLARQELKILELVSVKA